MSVVPASGRRATVNTDVHNPYSIVINPFTVKQTTFPDIIVRHRTRLVNLYRVIARRQTGNKTGSRRHRDILIVNGDYERPVIPTDPDSIDKTGPRRQRQKHAQRAYHKFPHSSSFCSLIYIFFGNVVLSTIISFSLNGLQSVRNNILQNGSIQ